MSDFANHHIAAGMSRSNRGQFLSKSPTRSALEQFCAHPRPGIAVYRIVNDVDGGFYIGSSINLRFRMRIHLRALRNGSHHSDAMQRAFVEHGEAAFRIDVVETGFATEAEAREAEQKLLDQHFGAPGCYNTSARAVGSLLEPESRAKAAAARRASKRWHASVMPAIEKMHQPEFRAKAKAACEQSAAFQENVLAQGQRMRALLSKPVIGVCVKTGSEHRFASQTEAAIAVNGSRSPISSRCTARRSGPYAGFLWRFAVD